ncbi:MAG TPA: hypothetical protein VGD59_13310 [Acidisarcina sp.]
MPIDTLGESEPVQGCLREVSESIADESRPSISRLTRYFAGDRCRVESADAAGYCIQRNDLRQTVQVMTGPRQYRVTPIWWLATAEERERFKRAGHRTLKNQPVGEGPSHELRIRLTYKATGEQQEMFGCPAYRWLTVRRDEHDDVAPEYSDETSTDEWYLDADYLEQRFPAFSRNTIRRAFAYATTRPTRTVVEHEGEKPTGLSAWSQSTARSYHQLPDGQWKTHINVSSSRILSLTEEDVPATMFEVPAGYSKLPTFPSRWSMLRLHLRNKFDRLRMTVPQHQRNAPRNSPGPPQP